MSTGTIIYYSGFGLLALTILLAILFAVKKPEYIPERASAVEADDATLRLRRDDSTERGEKRIEKSVALPDMKHTQAPQQSDSGATETMTMTQTLPVDKTATMISDETELMMEQR